eukprot:9490081-Pyramimonas_sp.AAC.1
MCAVAVGKPATPERWCCVTSGAKIFLDDVESAGGPPPRPIQSRVAIDLHTHEMIVIAVGAKNLAGVTSSLVSPASAPHRDAVVGCTKSHQGMAANFEKPYWPCSGMICRQIFQARECALINGFCFRSNLSGCGAENGGQSPNMNRPSATDIGRPA